MSLLSKTKILAIAAGVFAIQGAYAVDLSNANVSNGENIFKNGKGDVPACTSCHGQNGEGNDMMGTPRIAGQIYQFIVKQLTDFGTCSNPNDHATCKRQDKTMFVMNTNAMGLSEQDRIDVSAFLSTWHPKLEPSDHVALKEAGNTVGESYRGKILVNFGSPENGVSACRSCHDYNGRGADPMFPMIGNQKYVYLVNQLKNWRDGSRHNDPMEAMQMVARGLTDQHIYDVAAYLSGPSFELQKAGEYGAPHRSVPFKH